MHESTDPVTYLHEAGPTSPGAPRRPLPASEDRHQRKDRRRRERRAERRDDRAALLTWVTTQGMPENMRGGVVLFYSAEPLHFDGPDLPAQLPADSAAAGSES